MSGRPLRVSLVVAVADNGVIGCRGGLPWRLPSDLRRFRALTRGHPLIMGRKTFQSIGKPLDGRDMIVVSRSMSAPPPAPKGGKSAVAASFADALALARHFASARGVDEVFVIGGSDVFQQALPVAERIYLTSVHGSPEGDTRWQPPAGGDWVEATAVPRDLGEGDEFAVTDRLLVRRGGA